MRKLKEIKVLQANTGETTSEPIMKHTKTDAAIVEIEGIDHLMLVCPSCKKKTFIPLVTIRLLKHKQKYKFVRGEGIV